MGIRIYSRYVVISIVPINIMLAIELFYLTIFKELKTFLPCSFATSTVKGVDKFCKVLGIIDRFKEPCRQIAYGLVNPTGESMNSIRFHTIPKVCLPH